MPKFRRTRTTVDPEIAGLCSCGDPKVVTTQWERIGKEPEFACQITCVNCAAGVHSAQGLESGEEAFRSAKEKWLSKTSGDLKAKAAVLREESDKMWAKAKKVDNILKGVQ
jgi:hypothetical protein